ncbi:uncharacterized protein K02A2.6-like [Ornithodoros turicata]|uniref:uncharacterized protein K02A2.6-like n=1 Tax=Ornithodoros turicata TaxID=34597 RepID=UPI0031386381
MLRESKQVAYFDENSSPDDKRPDEFKTFWSKHYELSAHKNCLLWGNRVIIPKEGQQRVLDELQLGHPGIGHMRALARSYVWWPKIDEDIEQSVKSCTEYQCTRHAPPRVPIHPWEVPHSQWSRLHVDFAGPFHRQSFLLVVDAYSKELEEKLMPSTSAEATVNVLREIFTTHGIPDVVVSDNGPQFTSAHFQTLLRRNAIRQILVAPYHAASNGQAERMVEDLSDRLHPDGISKRQEVEEKQAPRPAVRTFKDSDRVYVRNYGHGQPWIPATIEKPTGPVSYRVITQDGRVVRRHLNQMRGHATPSNELPESVENPTDVSTGDCVPQGLVTPTSVPMDQAPASSPAVTEAAT